MPHGRRIVITGASSGIGVTTAALLARQGAQLALVARSRDGIRGLGALVGLGR